MEHFNCYFGDLIIFKKQNVFTDIYFKPIISQFRFKRTGSSGKTLKRYNINRSRINEKKLIYKQNKFFLLDAVKGKIWPKPFEQKETTYFSIVRPNLLGFEVN